MTVTVGRLRLSMLFQALLAPFLALLSVPLAESKKCSRDIALGVQREGERNGAQVDVLSAVFFRQTVG